jgi:hypothetical protein
VQCTNQAPTRCLTRMPVLQTPPSSRPQNTNYADDLDATLKTVGQLSFDRHQIYNTGAKRPRFVLLNLIALSPVCSNRYEVLDEGFLAIATNVRRTVPPPVRYPTVCLHHWGQTQIINDECLGNYAGACPCRFTDFCSGRYLSSNSLVQKHHSSARKGQSNNALP